LILDRAEAPSEVYLTLSADNRPQLSQRSATALEVVLGGWGGTSSLIRVGQQGSNSLALVKQRPMLSARSFRAFWVSGHKVHGQLLLRVGRGSRVGKQELMRALVPAAAVEALGNNLFVGFAGYDAPVNFVFGAVGTLSFLDLRALLFVLGSILALCCSCMHPERPVSDRSPNCSPDA
jgi:hypothetical protein